MKKIVYIILAAATFTACKKDSAPAISPLASLNVTNTVIGGAALTLNTSTLTVGNNNFAQFALFAGQSQVNLGVPATTTTPALPAVSYYSQVIPTANGDYYSLFLSGASPSAVDATLIKESFKNYTDSLAGVRFINLSPGSSPISVDIAGQTNGSEVASLAYKAYSDFKPYAARAANATYVFEIRDATSGTLIKSYTLATPRFHNVTIALAGVVGGSPAPAVILDKDF